MELGQLRVDPVIDGTFLVNPTDLYAGTAASDWDPHRDLLDPHGRLSVCTGGFLVRGGDRAILVDLGVGPAATDPATRDAGRFMQSLAAFGLTPSDITDVVLTHLHYDHVGWATTSGQPTFERATYRCHQADWDHFVIEHPGVERDLVIGASARFETWSDDGPLLPGIDTRCAPGHTPGSSVIILSSGRRRAVLLGDVVHCAVELLDDDWDGIYDVDPDLAKRTRRALVAELERDQIPVAAAHFRGLEFGRLLPTAGRRIWTT